MILGTHLGNAALRAQGPKVETPAPRCRGSGAEQQSDSESSRAGSAGRPDSLQLLIPAGAEPSTPRSLHAVASAPATPVSTLVLQQLSTA